MEIITTVKFSKERHNLVPFLKEIKPFVIHLMDPRKVHRAIDGKTYLETIEELIVANWTTMLMPKGLAVGQLIPAQLEGDIWTHVHLIANSAKDRLVLILAGETADPEYIHMGYIGSHKTLESYIKLMGISEYELYSNLRHLIED